MSCSTRRAPTTSASSSATTPSTQTRPNGRSPSTSGSSGRRAEPVTAPMHTALASARAVASSAADGASALDQLADLLVADPPLLVGLHIGHLEVDRVELVALAAGLVVLHVDGADDQEVGAGLLEALLAGGLAGVDVLVLALLARLVLLAVGGHRLGLAAAQQGALQVVGEDLGVHHVAVGDDLDGAGLHR